MAAERTRIPLDSARHGDGQYSGRELLRNLDTATVTVEAVIKNFPEEAVGSGKLEQAFTLIREVRAEIEAVHDEG